MQLRHWFLLLSIVTGLALGYFPRELGENGIAALWTFAVMTLFMLLAVASVMGMGDPPVGAECCLISGLGTAFAVAGLCVPYFNGHEWPWFTAWFIGLGILNSLFFLYNLFVIEPHTSLKDYLMYS